MISNIKYLTISDVHFGHRKNKTPDIIRNLDLFFDNYKPKSKFTDLDIIFIAGDLFDSLLDFASEDIHESTLWLYRLMGFCSRNKIKLRILEGTPSHDWKQSRIAQTVYDIIEQPFDFKYIDTLSIETFEDLGIKCLYIPDEWSATSDETFRQVKALLKSLNIEQVDIGIFHGLFTYQLPQGIANVQKHNEENYLNIVKRYINIGHVHTFSTFSRILAQGSFDRLAHGEEETKGAIMCTLSSSGDTFEFIENKNAKIFKTITIKNKDLDKSLFQIEKVLSKLPDNSYIRIKANKDHPLYIAFEQLKIKFPMYYFTKQSLEEEEETLNITQIVNDDQEYVPITIHCGNIVSMLMQEMQKYNLSPVRTSLLRNILEKTSV